MQDLLKKYEPEFVMKETTEIRIFYPKDKNVIKNNVDLFLFNNKVSKEQFVTTRTYHSETEKYRLVTDLVDQNFLQLVNKLNNLFELKQTYIIESDIYRIGDITIEFCRMYMEAEKSKIKYIFCINNSYGHSFDDSSDYVKEIMTNLFDNVDEKQIIDSCCVNEELLIQYDLINKESKKEEEHLNNIISDKCPQIKLLQYICYLFEQ
jgi:hypothetical protein